MKNLFILLFGFTFIFGGCQNEKKQEIQIKVDSHTSRTSVDWAGTYTGLLPCADCSGIETSLQLNNDNEFVLRQRYLDSNEGVFEEKGIFTWDETGSNITLQIEGEDSKFHQYKVGENILFKLDADGKRIEGDLSEYYELKKGE